MESTTNETKTSECCASSPLSFSDLVPDQAIVETLARCGITTPTPVQHNVIPLALQHKDVLAQAKTGSGKTLAFALPLVSQLGKLNPPLSSTYALIVTPTRELASQITSVINSLSPDLKPVCVIGGVSIGQQLAGLRADCRIVVGTPGRILDLLRQRELSLRRCRYFVVDEVDQMFSMDFIEDVRAILSRLPEERQGVFVSATLSPRVESLANSFLTKAEKIVINAPGEDLPPVDHYYTELSGEVTAKAIALCDLIEAERPTSAIIFCNTKSDTELVEVFLRRRGFDARRINSDLTQSQRDSIMQKIRAKDIQFLVATDIAARGLDIESIDMVINYTLPMDPESYIHRTGRTGRAGRSGRAVSLIGPQDFAAFLNIKRLGNVPLKPLALPTESEQVAARMAHLLEIVRTAAIKVNDKEVMTARKLLKELGGIDEPSEEITDLLAKLYHFITEHFVKQEAATSAPLEAELSKPGSENKNETERAPEFERSERRHDSRRSSRGDRGQHARGRDRQSGEGRSSQRSGSDRPRSRHSRDSGSAPRGRR